MGEIGWAAVHRMESAASTMQNAAGRAEEAAHRIAVMLEDGYGGNGPRLIELLGTDQAALCAQLEEQAREIERLKAQGIIDRDEQGRLREEIRSLTESKKFATDEACRFSSLYFESQVREREAVERAEKAENLRDYCRICPGCGNASAKGDFAAMDEDSCCLVCGADCTIDGLVSHSEELESALAAARKALEDAQTLIESGSPQMALMVILAALNGDSHANP